MQQAKLEELFGDDYAHRHGPRHRQSHRFRFRRKRSAWPKLAPAAEPFPANDRRGPTTPACWTRLGIEIGVLGGGLDGITYVSRLSEENPLVRSGTGEQENRFYFSQDSGLVELDRQLLAKADVESQNRVIVYFVPAAGEQRILTAEREHAQRTPEGILHTTFGVRAVGDGFEFYVIRQEPRP